MALSKLGLEAGRSLVIQKRGNLRMAFPIVIAVTSLCVQTVQTVFLRQERTQCWDPSEPLHCCHPIFQPMTEAGDSTPVSRETLPSAAAPPCAQVTEVIPLGSFSCCRLAVTEPPAHLHCTLHSTREVPGELFLNFSCHTKLAAAPSVSMN